MNTSIFVVKGKGVVAAVIGACAVLLAVSGCGSLTGIDIGPGTSEEPTASSPPVAPSNLTADHVAVYDVLVGWQDNSDDEDGFNVYRRRIDVEGPLMFVGASGENKVAFTDLDTNCGQTYEYVVASFNEAGESPEYVCWTIELPACPTPRSVSMGGGVTQGYNFLTSSTGINSDFYLALPTGGAPGFMADQSSQRGLVDLGDVGTTTLDRVTLPSPTSWVRDGLPVVQGHTYAALASDGESVIVLKVTSVGNAVGMDYIVWQPGDEKVGQCAPPPPGATRPPAIRLQTPVGTQPPGGNQTPPGGNQTPPGRNPPPPEVTPSGNEVCGCDGPDYACFDASSGVETSRIANDSRCVEVTEVCGCDGPDYACFDASSGVETSRIPGDARCANIPPPPVSAPVCGDGIVQPETGEECDPPDGVNCNPLCHVIPH